MPSRQFFIPMPSKGLWLGSWHGRVDAPVHLDWTSETLKVLGVFICSGNVDEVNWRPRIVAVKNVLNSWRQRGLSFRGKALIVNALALARIWYIAGLIHLPAWALRELSSPVFSLFWKSKPDIVARKVVSQPTSFGGFGVVSIQLKGLAPPSSMNKAPCYQTCVLGEFCLLLLLASLRLFAFGCSFSPFFF